MRILWVKVGGLWPLDAGGRIRSFAILSALSRRHRVTVLTTHAPGEDPNELVRQLPHCQAVISVPHDTPKPGSWQYGQALLRSWFSSDPVMLWKWRVPALRHEVGRRFENRLTDLCVADFLHTIPNIPEPPTVPVVLFAHNVEHQIWKRLSLVERSLWRRPLLAMEWRKMRRCEARVCAGLPLTIAVSEADQALLATIAPGANVSAIPTGVDIQYFRPDKEKEKPNRLVFTGSMDWFPNEDGMLHFLHDILPRIRQDIPDVMMTIVGRSPSPRLRTEATKAGVLVTGTVPDVRPYMAEAAVYVVPLRVGGGTRLKIFEALAMGKAVVSTTIGAEGLPLTPGLHGLLADDPANFAHAVVSLLRDAERRQKLGGAGRRLVEERYSWPQVAHNFEAYLKEVLDHDTH
jgi:polysaccharide biosynthesis protein PslH